MRNSVQVLDAPTPVADGVPPAPAAKQRVFPLHLSPIEVFMLADDQPGYAMTFVIRLDLRGTVDRPAFESALAEALARHPLLQAWIKSGKGGLPCWTAAGDTWPRLDWGAEGVPLECPGDERIDLEGEIGLRIWVRQGSGRASVVLQFHHACCDGTGAYRFIGDLLACYGMRTAMPGQCPELGPVQPCLLRGRKQRALGASPAAGRALTRLAIGQGWRILSGRPSTLAAPNAKDRNSEGAADFPGFLTYSFDRAEHQQLRDAAGRCGGMLNDLLLRDLFLTLRHWNRRPWSWLGGGRLTVMMPTDLREQDDYEMPAANMTSYTFLRRRAGQCASPDELLHGIRNETARIKHERSGTRFMETLVAAESVPWLLPFLLARRLSLATAVLSNAADPSRRFSGRFPRESGRIVAGNLVLEEIVGVPPLRRKTRVVVSISQYDRRLTISLRCDPHHFRREDAAALLALYVDKLRASASK